MGNFKANEIKILTALVADCVNYGFSEKEALFYIKTRFGKEISAETYYRRKKIVDSGSYASEWISYYSRVGFAVKHKQIVDVIEMVHQNTIKDYLNEQNKLVDIKDSQEIRRLRYEIRENAKLLQELSLGTPIVAQIKAKIDQLENAQRRQSSHQ